MSSADITVDGEGSTSELAPVQEWIAEMGQRLDGWSQSAKAISAEEWSKLRGVMAGTFAKTRVEGVLRDVLSRVGIRARDEDVDAMVEELRRRVLSFRAGQTIESYADYIVAPPSIRI